MTHAVAVASPFGHASPDAHTPATPAWLAALLAPLATWSQRLVRQGRMSIDPQDFAQEAVCRMVATYGETKLAATPPPVLRAIAWRSLRNMVVDEARRRDRMVVREVVPEVADPAPLADHSLDAGQQAARLERALATLGEGERAFILAVMRLDSVPAAQKQAGWPRASPYYHLRIVLDRLRDAMQA